MPYMATGFVGVWVERVPPFLSVCDSVALASLNMGREHEKKTLYKEREREIWSFIYLNFFLLPLYDVLGWRWGGRIEPPCPALGRGPGTQRGAFGHRHDQVGRSLPLGWWIRTVSPVNCLIVLLQPDVFGRDVMSLMFVTSKPKKKPKNSKRQFQVHEVWSAQL